jgi:hypothetical protein
LTPEPLKTSILANEPGSFQAEVLCGDEANCLGLHSQEGEPGVLLTVGTGDEDISFQLCPDDLPRLRAALDLCDQWATIEQAAKRAESEEQAA